LDETNGSQVEQVDHDELDEEEDSCTMLRNMSIGHVSPQVPEEPTRAQDQPSTFTRASPPTQDDEQPQEDEEQVQNQEQLKMVAYIKRDMKKKIKRRRMSRRFRQQRHHTQKSFKQFKETTHQHDPR
jgi:hypothetical protein